MQMADTDASQEAAESQEQQVEAPEGGEEERGEETDEGEEVRECTCGPDAAGLSFHDVDVIMKQAEDGGEDGAGETNDGEVRRKNVKHFRETPYHSKQEH